jgi:glutaredoxin
METLEIQKPSEKGYTIYTKSKCKYCTKVKELLKNDSFVTIIDCDPYLIDQEQKKDFLKEVQTIIGRSHKTFPMVFKDGTFVGGCDDVEKIQLRDHIMNITEFADDF